MAEYIQVFTSTARRDEAQRIAREVVERRLAACVQVLGPVSSTYRWKGVIETSDEWLCLIKTRQALFNELKAAIREVHPYEVPEILAVPVEAGSGTYLAWLEAETSKADQGEADA
jgi:periplasmic divalent cation tolerance protein